MTTAIGGIMRLLNRNNVSNLNKLMPEIEHGPIKAKHSQANGRISEILRTTLFKTSAELAEALGHDQQTYNHLLPQNGARMHHPNPDFG